MANQIGKTIILIGKTGSGKTTLIQSIEKQQLSYHKTQTICRYSNFLDTPGEYLEHRNYYKALLVSSYDVDVIGLVQDCNAEDNWFPPMFASAFAKETIGIITKTDIAKNKNQIQAAQSCWKMLVQVRCLPFQLLMVTAQPRSQNICFASKPYKLA